jgi:hypothetical protein
VDNVKSAVATGVLAGLALVTSVSAAVELLILDQRGDLGFDDGDVSARALDPTTDGSGAAHAAVMAAPGPSAGGSSPAATTVVRRFAGPAGAVSLAVTATGIDVLAVSPSTGWSSTVTAGHGPEVAVRFQRGSDRVALTARVGADRSRGVDVDVAVTTDEGRGDDD